MLARRSLHPLLALALLVLFSIPCSHAIAQDSPPSVSELRRENEQLRIRIDELETQLARSQEAISKLLEQVSELNTRVAALQEELRRRTRTAPGIRAVCGSGIDVSFGGRFLREGVRRGGNTL